MQYEPARWDTPAEGCTPGARALAAAVGFCWPHLLVMRGAYGCFNDRGVTGNVGVPSLHREGRAIDVGVPQNDHRPQTHLAREAVGALAVGSQQLGVQLIIFDRKIFRGAKPTEGWVDFLTGNGGPHFDHAHVELNWAAARELTVNGALAGLTLNGARPLSTTEDDDMPYLVRGAHEPDSVWERLPGGRYVRVAGPDFYDGLVGVLDKLPVVDLSHVDHEA